MGSSKRHQRNMKPPAQLRSRQTRSKGRHLLSDPALLTEQLRSLGLYAAPTLGDGNCLFRALSDQLYGTPSHHLQLRKDICDWIESHKQRYEPFCEDERGLDAHLRCMREQATYGGHLELSAFAHLTQRNVKVIQPGLVYVIEWAAGGDSSPEPSRSTQSSSTTDDATLDEREKRRLRRDKKRAEKEKSVESEDSSDPHSKSSDGAVYVAYHDWEHFSSIRNLKGPHTGLPDVTEATVDESPTISSPAKKKPLSKTKPNSVSKHTGSSKSKPSLPLPSIETAPPTPSQIPLPTSPVSSLSPSRSPSPFIELDVIPPSPLPPSAAYSIPLADPNPATPPASGLSPLINLRVHRSPKRSFDESSGSSASSEGVAKRTRSHLSTTTRQMDMDEDLESTPGLSAPGSSGESSSSSSSASSPLPSPPAAPLSPPPEKPLTRRQRKALGLPKPRAALVGKVNANRSAGKIVIPGGRYKKVLRSGGGNDVEDEDEEEDVDGGEWQRNGTGRVDVRGFRELKI